MKNRMPWGAPDDDTIRRLLPPTEYTYQNGMLCLKPRGIIILCDRVLDGTLPGNLANAVTLRTMISEEFPGND